MGSIVARERKLQAEKAAADAKLRGFIKKRKPSFLMAGEPVGVDVNETTQQKSRDLKAEDTVFMAACIAGRANLDAQDCDGFTCLHLACREADLEKVTILIKREANVNLANRFLWTPLHTAVFNGSISIVEKLLSANADVSLAEKYGLTVFHIAACSPRLYAIENVFKAYQRERRKARRNEFKRHMTSLASNLSTTTDDRQFKRGVTNMLISNPQMVTAEEQAQQIREFLRDGSDDPQEYARSSWRLEPNRIELIIFERLVQFKCPQDTTLQDLVNMKDNKRRTPLMYAAQYGNQFITSRLIHEGADLNLTDMNGDSALHYAVRHQNGPVVELLLMTNVKVNAVNLMRQTPLHVAIHVSDSFITSALLIHGANVNAIDSYGRSALMLALDLKSKELLLQLVLHEPDLTLIDEKGWTCAIRAVHCGLLLELLPYLIESEDLEQVLLARDVLGMNVLHHAIEAEREDYVRAIYTSKVGRSLLVPDINGDTPLHFAAQCGSIVNLNLISHDYSDLDVRNKAGETAVMLAARSGKMANVISLINIQRHLVAADSSLIDKNGQNLFMHACVSGNADLVRFILANDHGTNPNLAVAKVKVNQPDANGRTGLSLAAENGRWEVIGVLVLADASVAIKDNDGWTALHFAVNSGDANTVAALLDCEANINEVDGQGWTPLIHAVIGDHVAVAQVLIDRGADTSIKSNEGMTALEYLTNRKTRRNDDMMHVMTDGMRNHLTRLGMTPGDTLTANGHFEITVKTLEDYYLDHPNKYAIFASIMFKTEQAQLPMVHFTSGVHADGKIINWFETQRIDIVTIDADAYVVIEIFAAHRDEPLSLDTNLMADDLSSSPSSESSSGSSTSRVSTDHEEAKGRRNTVDKERKQLRIFNSFEIPWPPVKASHIPMGFVIVTFRTLREAITTCPSSEPLQLKRRLRASVRGHLSFDIDFRPKQAGYPEHPRLESSRPATPDAAAIAAYNWPVISTTAQPRRQKTVKSSVHATRQLVSEVIESSIKMSS